MEEVSQDPLFLPAIRDSRPGIFERLVLGSLQGMTQGHLRIIFPNGHTLDIGDRNLAHAAIVRIVRRAFFRKCVLYGDIGFGESYVDGDWETNDIAAVIRWFLLNIEHAPAISGSRRGERLFNILRILNRISHRLRDNTRRGSRRNISAHYDLSNEFFASVLDPGMTYSSAYFERPDLSLEEAQTAKYDRLCRELRLRPTDHVLEIGSGWGGFAVHAAGKYGCRVTSITVSGEQFRYARERVLQRGLEERVDIRFQDYRTVTGSFDRIVSIEMLEAVGDRHMETFFDKCRQVLRKDGLLGLQVITSPDSRYDSMRRGVDWVQKHIFPGSLLPSIGRINRAVNRTGDLHLHDLKDLGVHYAQTLRIWRTNFNRHLDRIRALGFDDRFARAWNYYFSYCEGAFAMKNISVVQMIYTRPNNALLVDGRGNSQHEAIPGGRLT